MSSIIAIRKIISDIILQPFHELYYDGTSVWTEVKSYYFAVSKNYLHSIYWLCFSSQFVLNALIEI